VLHFIDYHKITDTCAIGIKRTALGWFESYLSDRFQLVNVNEDSSLHTTVSQGSVLGQILFSLFMLPLGNIIDSMP